ncbi:MAG: hypothetical protein LBI82_10155 [Dysgonamonadaceae bacterium]|nr:hypothetical protein [Dysgonamonadaceae bacterium]
MKNVKLYRWLLWMMFPLFFSCGNKGQELFVDELPSIYPDYVNITIPYNIAPLNFTLRNCTHIEITLKGNTDSLRFTGKRKIQFPEKRWKKFLQAEKGNNITVSVKAKINGNWFAYRPFEWLISKDAIDSHLTYRLIEPGYEVWDKIQLCERNVENFSVKVFADYNLLDNSCMNCHITANQNPNISFFHLRGEKGGTILNKDGKLRKINTRTGDMFASSTYGNLHPSGRYGVFSSNIVIPQFHTLSSTKLEVYDTESDLLVIDFDNNRIIRSPLVSGKENLETFPCFSADGKRIYFCTAPALSLPDSIQQLRYSLCSIDFDADQGVFGNHIDTLVNMSSADSKSVSFPRPSPDGRFMLYCVSDYGTFPIWHRETDLMMIDLESGKNVDISKVNSDYSDTYHSWSSNSRWFVFASKRDDGYYGKPYFAYIDEDGKAHKPFVLPQRDPYYYDYTLKSFNIPELINGKLPFSASDIERIYKEGNLETLK